MNNINIIFLIILSILLGQLLIIRRCPHRKILYNLIVSSISIMLIIYYASDITLINLLLLLLFIFILNIMILINCNDLNIYSDEGFTTKIKEVSNKHKPMISDSFKVKLNKRKRKEDFMNNNYDNDKKSFRNDIYDYFNSFRRTPIGKWSTDTKESFSKLKIFKDKLYEII